LWKMVQVDQYKKTFLNKCLFILNLGGIRWKIDIRLITTLKIE